MELIKSLGWRYASKKMNGKKVPQEKVDNILKAIQFVPSTMGLQPYTILVITNPEIKKWTLPIANNQSQIVDSSHLLVFAIRADITPEQISEYIAHTAKTSNVPGEAVAGFKNSLLNIITKNTTEENYQWAARQAYIALGSAIAAEERVDATSMEGSNAVASDELLGLKEKGLRSAALLPLGYRDTSNNWHASLPKVRRQREKLFIQQ